MNKPLTIGISIFALLIVSLFTTTLAGVGAQAILNENSNANLSVVSYDINISELNIHDLYIETYYNETNNTIITNNTNTIEYSCDLYVNDRSYIASQIVPTLDYYELINQTLSSELTEGYHPIYLDCSYYINTTIITTNITENETLIDTLLIMNTTTSSLEKYVLIDTTTPQINILTQNITLNNNTNTSIGLHIYDLSDAICSINITSNIGANVYYSSVQINNSNHTNSTLPFNLSVPFNIINNVTLNNSINYTANLSCIDEFGHSSYINANIPIYNITNNTNNATNHTIPITTPFISLSTSKSEFGLGEIGYYTINAINNSNVTITICPVASGWVQCYIAPTFVNDTYPKTQALPYTNKTGTYIVQGVMNYGNTSLTTNISYITINTLTASITMTPDNRVGIGDTVIFNSTANSGIGSYKYRWVMHDGSVFNGQGAFKIYNTAGTYRVNLTVNDTIGNNYTTSVEVNVKNYYTLTVVVTDKATGSRVGGAVVQVSNETKTADNNGLASFKLLSDDYRIRVSKDNYLGQSGDVNLNSDKNVYINLSFQDLSSPVVTLLTEDDLVMTKDSVNLKFKADDLTKMDCSLYVAKATESWYTLKDSGNDLLTNTEYTFELRDLENDAYKWKIECTDKNDNKAYSEEKNFIVSDGSVRVALNQVSSNVDQINNALDNMDKLSAEELEVAETLGIKKQLKDLLNDINSYDRDINDLVYRRDLDQAGKDKAQKDLTDTIESMKYSIPIDIEVSNSKTFVKYVRDEELKPLLEEYSSIKKLNIDQRLFFESTKLVQSKIIVSTNVRNVKLLYLDGEINYITLVNKNIQIAKEEDVGPITGSNSITFIEVIPKSIIQSSKYINFVNKEYVILKEDPIIEYPSDTKIISYYLNDTIDPSKFQDTDTILIEKNTFTLKSTTGLSIGSLGSLQDINLSGQNVMIILIVLLIIFYIVLNFELIDKIRTIANKIGWFGAGKKVSFIKVLINDAEDYIKSNDFDKAALIYREIKLSYEDGNDYVRSQVYDESMGLCSQLDYQYALQTLSKAELYLKSGDRNNALIEFEKLEKTYSKLNDEYRNQLYDKFKKITQMLTGSINLNQQNGNQLTR